MAVVTLIILGRTTVVSAIASHWLSTTVTFTWKRVVEPLGAKLLDMLTGNSTEGSVVAADNPEV